MRPLVIIALLSSVAGATEAQSAGRIEGTITDSLRSAPLAGARVTATRLDALPEITLVAESNQRGQFVFERAPLGRYAIGFASALLDSLEYGGPSARVTVVPDGAVRVDLALPSRRTLRAAACPGVDFQEKTGALLGLVIEVESDRPLVGATVAVAWSELAAGAASRGKASEERGVRVTTDASGQYRLCGVPSGEWLLVQVQHAGRVGPVLRVSIADAVGVTVRNMSFATGGSGPLASGAIAPAGDATVGSASIAGTVRGEGGQPVRGAEVRVRGTTGVGRTDERGAFVLMALPSGTYELEVRHLGFGIARGAVELRAGRRTRQDVELARVVALDSVKVVARQARYAQFEAHKKQSAFGRFMDEEDIARAHVNLVTDLLATTTGFSVAGGPRYHVSSRWQTRRCDRPGANVVIDNAPYQDINDVRVADIGAIEMYKDPTSAPPQWDANCGLIVIWTRDYRLMSNGPSAPPASNRQENP